MLSINAIDKIFEDCAIQPYYNNVIIPLEKKCYALTEKLCKREKLLFYRILKKLKIETSEEKELKHLYKRYRM